MPVPLPFPDMFSRLDRRLALCIGNSNHIFLHARLNRQAGLALSIRPPGRKAAAGLAAMILNSPPHCGQCSRSMSKTRLSTRAQPMRADVCACSSACSPGLCAGPGTQAQHLLSGARPQGDAIRARGRLQCPEGIIGIHVGQVGHALLFEQVAQVRMADPEPARFILSMDSRSPPRTA